MLVAHLFTVRGTRMLVAHLFTVRGTQMLVAHLWHTDVLLCMAHGCWWHTCFAVRGTRMLAATIFLQCAAEEK